MGRPGREGVLYILESYSLSHQDGGPGGEGTVTEIFSDGMVRVRWDNGHVNSYRIGRENCYDLSLAPSELVTHSSFLCSH